MGSPLHDDFYLKIKKYEEDCFKVFKHMQEKGELENINLNLLPSYLYANNYAEINNNFKEKLKCNIKAI